MSNLVEEARVKSFKKNWINQFRLLTEREKSISLGEI